MATVRFIATFFIMLLAGCSQHSDGVAIDDAWARATAPGQEVAAAYMTLTSPQDLTLVKAESTSAGSVEIHSMTMNNGVMEMDMLESLPLKANQPYKLAPGGFHLMLFDLKKPLKAGETLPVVLTFKDVNGKTSIQHAVLPIKTAEE